MTMISSYYAQVGVGVDRTSLRNVDNFLNRIEKQMSAFQKRMSRTSQLNMRVNIDNARFARDVQRSMNLVGRNLTLRVGRIDLSGNARALRERISQMVNGTTGNGIIRIDARLSQASIRGMRQQMLNALSNITLNPRINPRLVNQRPQNNNTTQPNARGGYGRGSHTTQNPNGGRNFSPWHNPMMVGGGVGAFLRYGMYSLPLVAGTMGLNALSNNAGELQAQRIALQATAPNTVGADGQMRDGAFYQNYLDRVGERTGKKTSSLSPFFAQMLAGAKGTSLEKDLEPGFESLIQYSSVMGLGDESLKGAIKAFSQMIGKDQIMAEELRGQAAEHLPSVVRLMADVAAGGDVKKMNEMMQKGELKPAKYLPLLWERMRQESQPMMGEYQAGLRYNQGNTSRQSEEWLKTFLAGGAEGGITSVFAAFSESIKASIPYADNLGKIFERMSHFVAAMILVPKEMSEWWRGMDGQDNFMTKIFGKASESEFVQVFKRTFDQISEIIATAMSTAGVSIEKLGSGISTILEGVAKTLQFIVSAIELLNAYQSTGSEGVAWVNRKYKARAGLEAQAKNDYLLQGITPSAEDIRLRADVLESERQINDPMPLRTKENAPMSSGNIGIRIAEKLGFIPKDNTSEALPSTTSMPVPTQTPTNRGFFGNLLGGFTDGWQTPQLPEKATNPMRLGVENIHPNSPESVLSNSVSNRSVNVTVSGKVTIDGSVETPINEIQLTGAVNSAMDEKMGDYLGATLTQFGSDPN